MGHDDPTLESTRGRGHPELVPAGDFKILGRLEPKGHAEESLNLERQAGVLGLLCPAFRKAGGRVLIDKEAR